MSHQEGKQLTAIQVNVFIKPAESDSKFSSTK